jgi:hypothetical protein
MLGALSPRDYSRLSPEVLEPANAMQLAQFLVSRLHGVPLETAVNSMSLSNGILIYQRLHADHANANTKAMLEMKSP